ncbi:hypothetical protein FRC02_012423 [Tulasnella sp. 418]|nr:hypothetical protein FRC02_012423 [Tulasnella sp. 418]
MNRTASNSNKKMRYLKLAGTEYRRSSWNWVGRRRIFLPVTTRSGRSLLKTSSTHRQSLEELVSQIITDASDLQDLKARR